MPLHGATNLREKNSRRVLTRFPTADCKRRRTRRRLQTRTHQSTHSPHLPNGPAKSTRKPTPSCERRRGWPGQGTPPSGFRVGLTRREWLLVLIAGSIWGLFNVAYIVLISFAPALFTARGYSLAEASAIVSIIGWVLIPLIPFTGLLVERVGRPSAFMLGGFLVGSAVASALPFMDAPLFAFGVLAVAIGVPAGLIMVLPAQVLRPESRAGGMGVFFTCYYVAMAILPGAAGLARDLSGSAAAPALFAAAMTLLCALGLMLFHAAKQLKE